MSDVFGIQAVRAVLRESSDRARCLYLLRGRRDARINELIDLAKSAGVRHQAVDNIWFRRRVQAAAHQGVILECHEIALTGEAEFYQNWDTLPTAPLILLLDGLTDPRNLGACLRTANAAGVDAVLLPKRKSAPLSAVALKTAQGGAEGLQIVEITNVARALKQLQQRTMWVIGADGDADTSYLDMDAKSGTVLVMGSEGKGLRRLTKENCDQLVQIPMRGHVSSLNVSVATGVLLFEVCRQRD